MWTGHLDMWDSKNNLDTEFHILWFCAPTKPSDAKTYELESPELADFACAFLLVC